MSMHIESFKYSSLKRYLTVMLFVTVSSITLIITDMTFGIISGNVERESGKYVGKYIESFRQ